VSLTTSTNCKDFADGGKDGMAESFLLKLQPPRRMMRMVWEVTRSRGRGEVLQRSESMMRIVVYGRLPIDKLRGSGEVSMTAGRGAAPGPMGNIAGVVKRCRPFFC
jgi:hypothetical protein